MAEGEKSQAKVCLQPSQGFVMAVPQLSSVVSAFEKWPFP
jgi:hypothetical protein